MLLSPPWRANLLHLRFSGPCVDGGPFGPWFDYDDVRQCQQRHGDQHAGDAEFRGVDHDGLRLQPPSE